jgi:hypothetical protein
MVAAVALSVAMLVSVTALVALGDPPEHFLEYSEDNFKTQFISGNLTASMPRDWPRVDFQHSENLFAPMFEIGMTRMFLFNDTNGDEVFSRSEAAYTGFLDSEYVEWNMTAVKFSQSGTGESAEVSMSTMVSLYRGYVDDTEDDPAITDWANITFRFLVSEHSVTHMNSLGRYVVAGKTDLQIRMSIEVQKKVNTTRLALEQVLLGGGSVHHFILKEGASNSTAAVLTPVSYRSDERGQGLSFTHRFHQTSLPTQDVDFAKADGVVQAYYRFSSEPTTELQGDVRPVGLNSSYYSTGASLVVCPSYTMGNESDNLAHEMSIGLEMSGFVRVRDWVAANLPLLAIVGGGLVALTFASVHLWRGKRRRLLEDREDMKRSLENDPGLK